MSIKPNSAAIHDFSPSLVFFRVGTVRQKAASAEGYVGMEIASFFASGAAPGKNHEPVVQVQILVTCQG